MNMQRRMPSFLIIGAAKCGTTALYEYLKQHPDVFMSPLKEPNFFAFEGQMPDFRDLDGTPSPINTRSITALEAYQALFEGWTGQRAVGEASPQYLWAPQAAGRIKHYVPEARLVAVLRHPVERAYSAFMHAIRAGREPVRDFSEALRLEESRIRNRCGLLYRYRNLGFYYEQLNRYVEAFDRRQIRVYLYDDLTNDLPGTLGDLFDFLGVDPGFAPDTSMRHNPSGIPQNGILQAATQALVSGRGSLRAALARHVPGSLKSVLPVQWTLRMARKLRDRNLHKPALPPDVRASLNAVFREDIIQLQDLIGRDLSPWLQEPRSTRERTPEAQKLKG